MSGDETVGGVIVGVRDSGAVVLVFVDQGDGRLAPVPFYASDFQAAFSGISSDPRQLVGRRVRWEGGSVPILD
jgi:hypothetical protein